MAGIGPLRNSRQGVRGGRFLEVSVPGGRGAMDDEV